MRNVKVTYACDAPGCEREQIEDRVVCVLPASNGGHWPSIALAGILSETTKHACSFVCAVAIFQELAPNAKLCDFNPAPKASPHKFKAGMRVRVNDPQHGEMYGRVLFVADDEYATVLIDGYAASNSYGLDLLTPDLPTKSDSPATRHP